MIDMLLVRNRIILSSIKKSILKMIYRKDFFMVNNFILGKDLIY